MHARQVLDQEAMDAVEQPSLVVVLEDARADGLDRVGVLRAHAPAHRGKRNRTVGVLEVEDVERDEVVLGDQPPKRDAVLADVLIADADHVAEHAAVRADRDPDAGRWISPRRSHYPLQVLERHFLGPVRGDPQHLRRLGLLAAPAGSAIWIGWPDSIRRVTAGSRAATQQSAPGHDGARL